MQSEMESLRQQLAALKCPGKANVGGTVGARTHAKTVAFNVPHTSSQERLQPVDLDASTLGDADLDRNGGACIHEKTLALNVPQRKSQDRFQLAQQAWECPDNAVTEIPNTSETPAVAVPPVPLKRAFTLPPPKERAELHGLFKRRQMNRTESSAEYERKKEDGDPTKKGVKGIGFDPARVKEKLRREIVKPDHDVTRYYKDVGLAQAIARSKTFDSLTLFVILLNAVWIGIDTDLNDADIIIDANLGFQIGENLFCAYFSCEWLIRFVAFRRKRDGFKDGWFVFDTLLAFLMVLETWFLSLFIFIMEEASSSSDALTLARNAAVLKILRLVRLSRLSRAVKILRSSPEAMVMVKAMFASLRCVVYTLLLLMAIIYFFAVFFTQLAKGTHLQNLYFPTLFGTMHTLMIVVMFPDSENLSRSISATHLANWFVWVAFIMVSTICVLNLLIGVLVEVVKTSSVIERDALDVSYVKSVFVQAMGLQDSCLTEVLVSKEQLVQSFGKIEVFKALENCGIDVFGLVDLLEYIFRNGDLSFAALMEVILQLRSCCDVTVRDLVDIRKFITFELAKLQPQPQPQPQQEPGLPAIRWSGSEQAAAEAEMLRRLSLHSLDPVPLGFDCLTHSEV
eukprot:TRINITY_DN6781_c0_g1_i1.p1 TRINITY_DN6781_c0_g1~~TRINITY_DN6781_c0_g1_i1.p1  ORF type:complete len:697 (+),score=125.69 TRINITY_DN6781_c0_g1_i1:217-2091(+)